jgi:hypothetical protein
MVNLFQDKTGDPANSKLTDFDQPSFGQLGTTTDILSDTDSIKKLKKSTPLKNLDHRTLLTFAFGCNHTSQPKAKKQKRAITNAL